MLPLWTDEDLARFLHRDARKLPSILAQLENAPTPVLDEEDGSLHDPNAWAAWIAERSGTPIEARAVLPEHLWTIHDVANLIRRCENSARALIRKHPDAPKPVLTDGKGDLWDPRDWWAWIAKRSIEEAVQAAEAEAAKTVRLAGGKVRV